MTRTYAVLEVTPMAYQEIRQRLEKAGYQHAIDNDKIDMHGIALQALEKAKPTPVEVGTLLSHRTKRGMVELMLAGERIQMDVEKAREVVGMLQQAIEAAISDEIMYTFLHQKIGLSEHAASSALVDLRELRQGSRETVHPS
jgi:hypothetical protein